MGQKLRDDKIGTLSHSSGVITLGASYLTIGGQQYITGTLNRTITADVTLVANNLYMIYAVLSSGVPDLRVSANLNSVGPAGFSSWKLVGAFYANGLSSVSLGSFVNIKGVPKTENPIVTVITWSISGFAVSPVGAWDRDGRTFGMSHGFTKDGSAGVGGGSLAVNMPANLPSVAGANNALAPGTELVQINGGNVGNTAFSSLTGAVSDWTGVEMYAVGSTFQFLTQPTGTGSLINSNVLANSIVQGNVRGIPLTSWSNTALEDL